MSDYTTVKFLVSLINAEGQFVKKGSMMRLPKSHTTEHWVKNGMAEYYVEPPKVFVPTATASLPVLDEIAEYEKATGPVAPVYPQPKKDKK